MTKNSSGKNHPVLQQPVKGILESYLAQKVRGRNENRKTLLAMSSLMKKIQPFNEIIEQFVSSLRNYLEEKCRSDLTRALAESAELTAKALSRLMILLN